MRSKIWSVVPVKPFRPDLIFAGKAYTFICSAALKCYCLRLTPECVFTALMNVHNKLVSVALQNMVESFARDKHSSLPSPFISFKKIWSVVNTVLGLNRTFRPGRKNLQETKAQAILVFHRWCQKKKFLRIDTRSSTDLNWASQLSQLHEKVLKFITNLGVWCGFYFEQTSVSGETSLID
jgi:hypothetical protein